MKENRITRLIGQRILSEANDLKRTLETVSSDLSINLEKFKDMLAGKLDLAQTMEIAHSFSSKYPVKISDILLDLDESIEGVVFTEHSESVASSRVYSRIDKEGLQTEYYEYRDTAISKLSPFRPEWIKELRIVSNDDPENPDVAYNNGHLMHQMTTFVGPVNFYWEVNGQKYCREMNTGDSNFITPFWKHSFTSRDESKEAYIVAVTFSGDVGRARNELYALGEERVDKFCFDNRNLNKGVTQVIKQIMNNNLLSKENLQDTFNKNQFSIKVEDLLDESVLKKNEWLEQICKLFNLPADIFDLPINNPNDEVILKFHDPEESYFFDKDLKDYEINQLAQNPRMPECMGSNMRIFSKNESSSSELVSSLHSFIFNYGDSPFEFSWESGKSWKNRIINSGDSIYMNPHIPHKMWRRGESPASLFLFRVPGFLNLKVQKELSSFADTGRIIEKSPWFN